jgi:vitamin B12 transporter
MRRVVPTLLLVASATSTYAAEAAEAAEAAKTPETPEKGIPLIVTADRHPTEAWRSTATTAVVTSDDDRERGYTSNLTERINGLPGVSALGVGGGVDGGISSIRIRGANSYDTRILLDGIPVIDPTGTQGQANTAFIDGSGITSIEVVNGAQSGLYGSNSGGGVVNLLTVRPTAVPTTTARIEAGSFGTARVNGTTTGPLGESFGYAVAVGAMHSDGISSASLPEDHGRSADHERDPLNRLGVTARVEARPAPGTTLYVGARGDLSNQDFDAGFPTDPEDASADNKFRSLRGTAGGAVEIEKTSFSADAAHTASKRVYDTAGYAADYRGREDYLAGKVTMHVLSPGSRRDWAVDRVDLTLGGDVQRDQATISDGSPEFSESAALTGGWAQALIGDRYVEASVSGRIDHHSQEGDNGTWRCGLAVFPIDEIKLHAALGTGFRAPSLYELYDPFAGNPALAAQRSRSSEIGQETRLPGGLTFSNVVFRTDYLQSIDYDFSTNAYANTGAYHSDGVESALAWKPEASGPRVLVAWTWQHANPDSEAHLLNIPRNRVVVQSAWYFDKAWASLRLDGVSSRPFGQELPGYALLGAAVGYTIDRTWEVYMRGENLTNTAYEVKAGYATPGASGYGGVTATF